MGVWISVLAIIAGFVVAGIGLIMPEMWVIVAGAVIAVVSGLAALRIGIMESTH